MHVQAGLTTRLVLASGYEDVLQFYLSFLLFLLVFLLLLFFCFTLAPLLRY